MTFAEAEARARQLSARTTFRVITLPDSGLAGGLADGRTSGLTGGLADEQIAHAIETTPVAISELLLIVHSDTVGDAMRARADRLAIDRGFRRHPLLFACVDYADIEQESGWLLLPYERLAGHVFERYPPSRLAVERALHMDMSREEGRRSDAHLARYRFASEQIGDTARILDAACGLGYGSNLLWREASGRTVTGVDLSQWVVDYATANFGAAPGAPRFRTSDVGDLSTYADASFDAVVSFETVEHLLEPAPFLSHVRRVLAEDGLFIASVPYRWVANGDTGPHHHDWFDAPKLLELCGRFLSVESLWAETAGGSYYLPDGRRGWRRCPTLGDVPDDPIEWLIIVARKRRAVSRSTKSWLLLAPGISQLSTMAAALPAWGIAPDAVHVRGLSLLWDDAYESTMQAACEAFGFEYGGNLSIDPSLTATVGDPLEYDPEHDRDGVDARDGCGPRVRERYPVLDGLHGLNVILSARPDSPGDYALLAGLQPTQVRLVADGIAHDLQAYDMSGARGFEVNALVGMPTSAEIACPPWLETETRAIGRPQAIDPPACAAALARVAASAPARALASAIATRPVPFTAVVISESFDRLGPGLGQGLSLTSTEASRVFALHQIRALLRQTPGAVLFKTHPRDSRRTIAALADALREAGAEGEAERDRVHITTDAEGYLPLEAFACLADRVDTLDVWGTSSTSLLGVSGWRGARPRCVDAEYLEPETRRRALQFSRRHNLPLTTLRFDDPLLTDVERQHLRRRFQPPPAERRAAALQAQAEEAELARRAARAFAERLAARVTEVEGLSRDSLLLEALVTKGTARVWIWGCGAAGRLLLQRLRRLGVEPVGFLDSSATPASPEVENVRVWSADAAREARRADALIVIASVHADQILERVQQDGDWQSTRLVWAAP